MKNSSAPEKKIQEIYDRAVAELEAIRVKHNKEIDNYIESVKIKKLKKELEA